MICVSQNGVIARRGIPVGLLVAIAGAASGQLETRDWLLSESGFWSDASRWSDADVPDSPSEIVRLSPAPQRSGTEQGDIPTVSVDGAYEVYRVVGDGGVRVRIDPGSTLNTLTGLYGEDDGTLAVDIGSTDLDGGAALNVTGARAFTRSALIRLADLGEASSLGFDSYTVLDEATTIEGAGMITGEISNHGRIASKRFAPTGVVELTIDSADIVNWNEIRAGSGAYLVFDQSAIDQRTDGRITSISRVTFRDSSLLGGTIDRSGRGSFTIEGQSSFEDVHIDNVVLNVDGELALLGNEFRNDGFVYVDDETGVLTIDDEIAFVGEGRMSFGGSAAPASLAHYSPGGKIRNGVGHTITGWGDIGVPLTNDGILEVSGNFNTAGFIEIQGAFEQEPTGLLELVIDEDMSDLIADRIIINRNTAHLAGTLRVRLYGNIERFVGKPIPAVRILQNSPSQTINGEFDTIELFRNSAGQNLSPILGVEYLPDRVNLTLYCIADVNRDGVVSPSDFSAWVSAYNEQSSLADANLDGVVNTFDFNAWVSTFNSGCGR